MLHLPPIDSWPAHILAKAFSEEELCEAHAYLEMVSQGVMRPGPEMANLGMGPNWTIYEVLAVQHRLELAIHKIHSLHRTSNTLTIGNVAA